MNYTKLMPVVSPLHYDFYRLKLLKLKRVSQLSVDFIHPDFDKLPSDYIEEYSYIVASGKAAMLEIYNMCQVYGEGPKILQLEQLDLEIFEQMNLNITLEDYAQPFHAVLVELPEKYWSKRIIPCLQAGQKSFRHAVYPDTHYPCFVVSVWEEKERVLSISMYFSTGQVFSFCVVDPDIPLDELFQRHRQEGTRYFGSMDISPEEEDVAFGAIRVALNACLFVDEVGIKSQGPKNKSHYERLKKHLHNRKKDPAILKREQMELACQPFLYTFDRKIKMYDSEIQPVQHDSTGGIITPHPRRGYYKMQPHGPGNTLRKRIRIPPCFVNAHLFVGDPSQIKVIYK